MEERRVYGTIKVAQKDFGKVYELYFSGGKLKVDRILNMPLSCYYNSDGISRDWVVEEGLMILFSGTGNAVELRKKRPPEVKHLKVNSE